MVNSLLMFGPRPLDVRARPAEAQSEERAEPTFVGENAPQDRNEGGRDAAASGRREKINGLLTANARPEAAFVVLDDEAPSAGLDGHWVRTDPAVGLSEDDIDTAVTILSLPSSLRADR